MPKYQALTYYLQSIQHDYVLLTLSEIEKILGFSLPRSARQYNAWWANDRRNQSHSWSYQWIQSGWESFDIKLGEETVSFRRFEEYAFGTPKAIEGYEKDRMVLNRNRNRALADKRKELDGYQCQTCGFKLELNGSYVIEVHHLKR